MTEIIRPTLATDTILVRGGQTRSSHKETSEALYLTSGFVYDSAAEAEARFKGDLPGFASTLARW